jgi:salicylate hydroxylase
MDAIEPGFRSEYEKICVGNKSSDAQDVFFEGMLLEEGLGTLRKNNSCRFQKTLVDQRCFNFQVKISRGMENRDGVTLTSIASRSVSFPARAWVYSCLLKCTHQAHRKALLDIMTNFIPIENVKFSKRLANIEQHSDRVVLHFADETFAGARIVVGADGIQSTVRKNVLEPIHPGQVQPVYANSYCYRAVLPMAEAYEILGDLTDTAKFFFGRERGCVTYRISGGEVSCHQIETT